MSDKTIDTGIQELDKDLQEFFEVTEDEKRFKEIVETLTTLNENLKQINGLSRSLNSKVPEVVVRLALTLGEDEKYKELLQKAKEESRPSLEKAKNIVDRDFEELLEIYGEAQSRKSSSEGPLPEVTDSPLTHITNVHHMPEWLGNPQSLIPAVRIAIRDPEMKSLLTATLEWKTLFFLFAGFTELTRIQLESGILFVEKGYISRDAIDEEAMGRHILDAQKALDRIKELAPKLGIDLEKKANNNAGDEE